MPELGDIQKPLRWPLATPPGNRGQSGDKDARLINCFAELDPTLGGYRINKRPSLGQVVYPDIPPGGANGTYLWENINGTRSFMHVVQDRIYKGGVALSGTFTLPVGMFTFTPMRSVPSLLAFGDGNKGYYTDGTTVHEITDISFPRPYCPGMVYLDGTLYAMSLRAEIFGTTNLDDPTAWSALNKIIARIEPDRGVALAKQLTYIIALKQWTTEVFYDAGNATGSPLAPIEGAKINYGCADADSVQDIDGSLIWVTNNRHLQRQVIRMDALQSQIISTPPIERLLIANQAAGYGSCTLKLGGHRYYVLDCFFSNITLVYDLDQQLWYYWAKPNGDAWGVISASYDAGLTNHLVQLRSSGQIVTLDTDENVPGDLGAAFPVDIYTPNFDAGVDRQKTLHQMYVNADLRAGSKLYVRCNDYDYDPAKWTNFREVNLGLQRPMLDNCGTFYRRAYHFRHMGLQPFRMSSVALNLDIGTF